MISPVVADELRQLRGLMNAIIEFHGTQSSINPHLNVIVERAKAIRDNRIMGRGTNEYALFMARKARSEKARAHRRRILAFIDEIGKGYGYDDIRFMAQELNRRADMTSMSGKPWTVIMLQRLIAKEARELEETKKLSASEVENENIT